MATGAATSQAAASLGTTERVSVGNAGAQGNDESIGSSAFSEDGRFVAFSSEATNLDPVPGVPNSTSAFVRDRTLGTTERVSVLSTGQQILSCFSPTTSGDGRFVAFNCSSGAYVRDRHAGTTETVDVNGAGEHANAASGATAISADGRFVAFTSLASNLAASDTNGRWDVFVRDRQLGTTERASVDSSGAQSNGPNSFNEWLSHRPVMSPDGRYVAFDSDATNLVANDTNGRWDSFVHDRLARTTKRVSVGSNATQANDGGGGVAMSADGRFFAFVSGAANLVPGDTNSRSDAFVYDQVSDTTQRVSVDSFGGQASDGHGGAGGTAISADGRFVAFDSPATTLVPGDSNGAIDVFIHDRVTGVTERVSVDSSGLEANKRSIVSGISADGSLASFWSDADNLVPGDTNATADVFLRIRASEQPPPANRAPVWVDAPPDSSRFEIDSGSSTSFELTARDPDGDTVIFTARAFTSTGEELTEVPAFLTCRIVASSVAEKTVRCTVGPHGVGHAVLHLDAIDPSGLSAGVRKYFVGVNQLTVLFVQGIGSESLCEDASAGFVERLRWLRNSLASVVSSPRFLYYAYQSPYTDSPTCANASVPQYSKLDSCWSLDDKYGESFFRGDRDVPGGGQATRLAEYLRESLDANPDDIVSIVAHSQGGVLAGYAVKEKLSPAYRARIRAIVTLDSPLRGTNSAGMAVLRARSDCANGDKRLDSAFDMGATSPVIQRVNDPEQPSIKLFTVDADPGRLCSRCGFPAIDDAHSTTWWAADHIRVPAETHSDIWDGCFVEPIGRQCAGPDGLNLQSQGRRLVRFAACAIRNLASDCKAYSDQ